MSIFKTIFCSVLIFCVLRSECAEVEVDLEDVDVEAGKSAIKKIQEEIGNLKDSTILKNVVAAGKVIGHTASAVQSIVSLITGPSESEELQFMKEQFAIVNTQLDALEFEFTEIKNLIDWNTMKVNVGEYERIITALEVSQQNFINAPPSIAEIFSEVFMDSYELQYQDAALKLYNALASDGVFQENIISVARRQLKEHQAQIAHFVSYILLIIQRGVILEDTYYAMKGDHKIESRRQNEWESRFKALETVAADFDKAIRDAWSYQYKIDSDEFTVKRYTLDNRNMATQLFEFLQEKYTWRYWFVLVYTFTDNNPKDRMFDHCNGWNSGNVGNKVVIVNSMSPEEAQYRKSDPNIFFRNLRVNYGDQDQIAKILFESTPVDCNLYHFKGVFETKSEPSFWALKDHFFGGQILISRPWSGLKYYDIFVLV